MRQFNYPHTIDNGAGEKLTFLRCVTDGSGDYLEVENFVQPNAGPPMHVHFKQEESIMVMKGKIGVQHLGGEEMFFGEGETVTFKPGDAHRFWNAETGPLICKGYVRPAHNIVYFLTEIYRSIKENGGKRPGNFDSAWLLTKYSSEFDMPEIPAFVKKVIFPVTIFLGKLSGKHKKFSDAPEPVK